MTRRKRHDPKAIERSIDAVMRQGYYVVEFSPYHFRIQDTVDFWPSTARWLDGKGYKPERKGVGLNDLIAYLKENYPIDLGS